MVEFTWHRVHVNKIVSIQFAVFVGITELDVVHGFRWRHGDLSAGYGVDEDEMGAVVGSDEPAVGGAHGVAGAKGGARDGEVAELVRAQVVQCGRVVVTVRRGIDQVGTLVRRAQPEPAGFQVVSWEEKNCMHR